MYRCGVGSGPLKDVQSRESTSLCHGQIRTNWNCGTVTAVYAKEFLLEDGGSSRIAGQ